MKDVLVLRKSSRKYGFSSSAYQKSELYLVRWLELLALAALLIWPANLTHQSANMNTVPDDHDPNNNNEAALEDRRRGPESPSRSLQSLYGLWSFPAKKHWSMG